MDEPYKLFLDIETRPNLGWTWAKWETNVIEFEKHWSILSFSAKWDGGEHITKGLPNYRGYKKGSDDDEQIVRHLWKLLDRAAIIIMQNGDKFDVRKMNARFVYYGIPPPSPYRTVDTLKVARKYFAFDSNKLDDMGEFLGLGRKMKHEGFDTWKGCMLGDRHAWSIMLKYNRRDVVLLERIYKRFLPWIANHPNVGMWNIGSCCPKCGSQNLVSRGYQRYKTTKYRSVQCRDCGGYSRTTFNEQENKPLVGI